MGVGAAVVAASVLAAGATAYSVKEQRDARKEQAEIQKKAVAEQRRLQEEQAAQAAKEKAAAEAELKAQQDAKRGGRGGLLFGSELGTTGESGQTTKSTLG